MLSPSGFSDPRNPELGWRELVEESFEDVSSIRNRDLVKEFEGRRIGLAIPKYGHELIPNETFILEMGFDKLNGVSFSKGCQNET